VASSTWSVTLQKAAITTNKKNRLKALRLDISHLDAVSQIEQTPHQGLSHDVYMKTVKCLLFLPLLCLFVAAPSHANDLTLFGGTQNPGSLTLRSVSGAIVAARPRTFGTFGIRFSHGRVVGSETTFAYSPNFVSSQHSAIIINSNLMVQAPLPVVRPYATAGLGTFYVRGSGLQAVTGAKFAVNYGGGAKVKLAGPLGAQLDARGYTIFSMNAQTLHVLEVSVGLVFSF
jgi:hypothetical protein